MKLWVEPYAVMKGLEDFFNITGPIVPVDGQED